MYIFGTRCLLVCYGLSSAHFSILNLLTELLTSSMLFYAHFGVSKNQKSPLSYDLRAFVRF